MEKSLVQTLPLGLGHILKIYLTYSHGTESLTLPTDINRHEPRRTEASLSPLRTLPFGQICRSQIFWVGQISMMLRKAVAHPKYFELKKIHFFPLSFIRMCLLRLNHNKWHENISILVSKHRLHMCVCVCVCVFIIGEKKKNVLVIVPSLNHTNE